MMKTNPIHALLLSAMLGLPVYVMAQETGAVADSDSLALVEKDRRGAIYADPQADWTIYSKIMLDEATVAFRKNWERDRRLDRTGYVSPRDIERIKADMAELFYEVWVEELSVNGGFEIVEEAGPDVLRITPKIVDLDVYAPSTSSPTPTYSFTDSSGRMTLKLELYDSETGDLIALASDTQQSTYRGRMEWTTGPSNRGDARDMLRNWAQALNARLQEATGKGSFGSEP
jgi:hypothetical protein